MPFDDAARDAPRPEKGHESLRPENAPVSVHGDELLGRRKQRAMPDEEPSPADEEAQSPLDDGFSLPSMPDEPAMTRRPNVETKADLDARDLLSLLPFL